MSRADASRNRQRLIEVALVAFSGDAPVALEAIARDAGVGIGTLYRHFPSRESLLEAVYRNELERLCASTRDLLHDGPRADVALRRWMAGYADFVGTKRGMAEALREIIATGAITSFQTREQLRGAVADLLAAGVTDGSLRGDVIVDDVVAVVAGILLAAGTADPASQVARMLDLLLDGLRAGRCAAIT